MPVLRFKEVFGLEWGIRLRAGTEDKLVLTVKDGTRGVDQFDCLVYGFKRIV